MAGAALDSAATHRFFPSRAPSEAATAAVPHALHKTAPGELLCLGPGLCGGEGTRSISCLCFPPEARQVHGFTSYGSGGAGKETQEEVDSPSSAVPRKCHNGINVGKELDSEEIQTTEED